MIRDPSDGSVRTNPHGESPSSRTEQSVREAEGAKHVLETATSGLRTGSQKPESVARLERSREQLKRYHETGKWDDLVHRDNEPKLPSES